ncbi:DNA gyrase subunit A [Candidatus Woesearchaeota archaeon]|nr:DNA gyrase subunit A [Candidatus Woesearchaeota archaeon]
MADSETVGKSRIFPKAIEEEMKRSYIDYAMSVIIGRALPDARDGLKPVHRRVLYTMLELGLLHNKPFKKCARIVGDCLGKYHPHGDVAVYDALVRMAQDFSLRYPLVNGQGNFGSVDGDSAAAMRYTEARLAKISEELLADIDKETVDFQPNFDASLKEPIVLPSKVPNLLLNGSSGIAVGMATNIPPHNIHEICSGVSYAIDNPECSSMDLMKFIKGPDFPTAGIIQGSAGIRDAYATGRGKIRIRAKSEIIEEKGRQKIIITEIPYQVNKSVLVEEIAALVKDKKVVGISDIRDESSKTGMRVVIELKKDATANVILNQLYAHTKLVTTFGVIMIALVDNEPKLLTLKDVVSQFILHRKEVVKRRTAFELRKAQERSHILEGLIVALNHIDDVVKKIKASKDVQTATAMLISDYKLTDIQAKAILEMRLQKLASLEQQKIRDEHAELLKLIEELKAILASERKILDIIKKELEDVKNNFADKRRTEIIEEAGEEIREEQLIKPEDVVVTITHSGYIKRTNLDSYKQQGRGGKGIIAAETKEGDFIEHLFVSNTHSYLLLFTDKGKIHWIKIYELPEASRHAMGKAVINFVQLENGEKVKAFVPVKEFDDKHFLIMATKNGTIKKTNLIEYSRPRKGGIIAITLEDNDDLIEVAMTSGKDQIMLATLNGMAARFDENDVRPCGRSARGVRGIKLKSGDEVIGMVIADDKQALLTITENGYGKRSPVADYRLIGRGGSGVINIQCTERNGKVASIMSVTEEDEVVVISQKGIMIRIPVVQISLIGRNTQGVRIMKMGADDKVVAAAKVVRES